MGSKNSEPGIGLCRSRTDHSRTFPSWREASWEIYLQHDDPLSDSGGAFCGHE